MVAKKDALLLPMYDFGITVRYNIKSHLGIDFGWHDVAASEILSVQDGVVVDKFGANETAKATGNRGWGCVVQHNYPDGTHRWTGYIHMISPACVNVGDKVTMGQKLGIRGNTGYSNGPHLHIYVTACTTKPYAWNTMKSLCTIDPEPLFYRSNNIAKYSVNKDKPYAYSYATADAKEYGQKIAIEDLKFVEYPEPVERDEFRAQIEIHDQTTLRMRSTPTTSTSANIYDQLAKNGIFNILGSAVADGWTWYKIGESEGSEFWVAAIESYVRVLSITVLPKPVERNTKVKQCEVIMDTLLMRNAPAGVAYDEYCGKGIYNVLAEEKKALNGVEYLWYKIFDDGANQFWVASGGARTKDLLPEEEKKEETSAAKINELLAQIDKLKETISNLSIEDATHKTTINELTKTNASLQSEVTTLKTRVSDVTKSKEAAENKISEIKKIVR